MLDWESPSSPSVRPLFHPYNPSAQWSAAHPASPQLGQSSFASLQPSTSIWGPQVQKSLSPPNLTKSAHTDDAPFPLTYGGNIIHQTPVYNHSARHSVNWSENKRRLPSVPSLADSAGSSNWTDENYMVSPPSSPGCNVIASNPVSPKISPIGSPKTKSQTVSTEASFGNSDGDEAEEMVISSFCGPLYLVKFKGGRVDVFMAPGTSYYAPGDSVMVDADRGSDLGEVIQANVSRHDAIVFKQKQNKDRTRALSASNIMGSDHQSHGEHAVFVPKQIIGRATPSNIRDMAAKCRDEAAAVAVCNAKVAERGLNMEIVDAEYQWDRRKLTFFYNAGTRVDFRDLVRDLFRIYKTRIWMCATTAR